MAFTTPGTAVAGDVLTAAFWNSNVRDNLNEVAPLFAAWTSWTPVLTATTTNPTIGTGNIRTGQYQKVGTLVNVQFRIVFGTSGVAAGSGVYRFTLPITPSLLSANFDPIGHGVIYDSSAADFRVVSLMGVGGDTVEFYFNGATNFFVTNAQPWTWAAGDVLNGQLTYRTA
jgi:hypothetical protein